MSFIYDVTLLLTVEVIKHIWKKTDWKHTNQKTRSTND